MWTCLFLSSDKKGRRNPHCAADAGRLPAHSSCRIFRVQTQRFRQDSSELRTENLFFHHQLDRSRKVESGLDFVKKKRKGLKVFGFSIEP